MMSDNATGLAPSQFNSADNLARRGGHHWDTRDPTPEPDDEDILGSYLELAADGIIQPDHDDALPKE